MYHQGAPHIDIRQWSPVSGGEWKPSNKGIRLTSSSWLKLLGSNEHLVADIFNMTHKQRWVNKQYPLGEDFYASITSPWSEVDLYFWDADDKTWTPGMKGINLKFPQWTKLMELSSRITMQVKTNRKA